MANGIFEEICNEAFLDLESFLSNLKVAGLSETVQTLPDDLCALMATSKRRGTGIPNFGELTVNFLDQVNANLRNLQDSKLKSRTKSQIQAFAYFTVKRLIREFPELESIEHEIEQGLESYQSKPETDVADLLQHTELFRKSHKGAASASSTSKPSQKERAKDEGDPSYGFMHHLGDSFERLNESVCKQYAITKSIGDFRQLFSPKRKPIKPIALHPKKEVLFLALMHELWDKELISPHEGGFWDAIAACLRDGDEKFSGEKLRKDHNRILKKPGKKHAQVARDVASLLMIASEKRTKS